MNCQSARELFPELLDHRTDASAHAEVRAHLAHCPDCQREFAALRQTLATLDTLSPQPSPRLRQNFYALLEEEKHSAASVREANAHEARARRRWLLRWVWSPAVACAVLLFGFRLGARYGRVEAPAPVPADDATRRELAELRKQVNKMSQLVGYSLLQQQQGPVNERLRDVLRAASTENPNEKVLDDLISALAFDPNINVRLRALEALQAHASNVVVRSGVLAALPREQNPLVQLELIDFVATAHDRDAAPVLEKMSQNEAIDESVRAAAQRALAQL
jgi:flagellar motility protein MotE (MotC chaperone)